MGRWVSAQNFGLTTSVDILDSDENKIHLFAVASHSSTAL
jgi:hypothetical protein